MSEAPRFFVGPEDTEINAGNYRHFFHHADEDEEEEDESVSVCLKTSKIFTDHCEGGIDTIVLNKGRLFFFPHIEFCWKFLN